MLNMTEVYESGAEVPILLLASKLFKPSYLYWYIMFGENRN